MKKFSKIFGLLLVIALLSACGEAEYLPQDKEVSEQVAEQVTEQPKEQVTEQPKEQVGEQVAEQPEKPENEPELVTPVPYDNVNDIEEPFVVINDNKPTFTKKEIKTESFESYSELDELGRCGVAVACVGKDIMPTEERGAIGSVKPTGWQTIKYPGVVDGGYLYNRCHLIGYQLTAENANKKNLITGTRYLNVDGMLPFENMVADYVKETGNHVMYRVTPVFDNDNLVATGVQMEAKSVEDKGAGILFNVFCYNIQPGVIINYEDGTSSLKNADVKPEKKPAPEITPAPEPSAAPTKKPAKKKKYKYAVNVNSGKIHINGGCAATTNSENQMTNGKYCKTYKEALKISKSVEPNLKNRKCGNCY